MQLDYRNLTPQTWTAYILMFNEANEVHLRNMDPRQRVEVLTALKDYGEKKGFGFPDKFNTYLPKAELAKGAGVQTAADEEAWERAKAIVSKEYGSVEDHWPVVQRLFQSIKKANVAKALPPAREYGFRGDPGEAGYQRAAMVGETIEHAILSAFSPVVVQPPMTRRGKDADYPFEGFIDFQGIPIDVENLCGSERKGVDRDGHAWCTKMHAHYGEIRRSEGTDGDKLDVYVGPSPGSSMVVVVDQAHPDTGTFDEQKVILGFDSEAQALALYRKQYDRPGFYRDHRVMDVQALKSWLRSPESRGSRVIPSVRSSQ